MSDSVLKEVIGRMLREIRIFSFPELLRKRYGTSDGDGGYVLSEKFVENAYPMKDLLSFGIGDNCDFERSVSLYFRHIQMMDIEEREFSKSPNMQFFKLPFSEMAVRGFKEVVGSVLKFDVEGAEWNHLSKIVGLRSFFQIVGEFHFFPVLPMFSGSLSPYFTKVFDSFYASLNIQLFLKYYEVLRVLNQKYYCFHVHANNSLPPFEVAGISFPPLLEMSWIRKDLVGANPLLSEEVFPAEGLDVPNKKDRFDYIDTLRFFNQ